jgi:hypothetical protein
MKISDWALPIDEGSVKVANLVELGIDAYRVVILHPTQRVPSIGANLRTFNA